MDRYKEIKDKIKSKYDSFPKNQRKIADFFVNNFDRIPFLNVQELSESTGSSVASIVRFAQRAGYKGFSELREAITDSLQRGMKNSEIFPLLAKHKIDDDLLTEVANLDIKNITLEDAKAIYYRDYWLNSGAQVADISPELAFILFDAAVNMGTGTSVRLLQRALRVREDGIIGPNTRKALETANLDDTLEWTVVNRLLRYSELETWPRYRRGWLKRTVSLLRRA